MKHIVVVSEDKTGLLADISYLLGKAKVNMENVSIEVVGNKAIAHIFVKNEQKASQTLSANGYKVLTSDNIVLRIENKPGEFAKVAEMLKKEGIEIKNVNLLTKGSEHHVYSLITDKNRKSEKLLSEYIWVDDHL